MMYRIPKGPAALAVLLTLTLAIWLLTGEVKQSRDSMEDPFVQQAEKPARVEITTLEATVFQPQVIVQGEVTPWRKVTLTARVSGTVEALPVALGEHASRDDTLVTLSEDGRRVRVEQARSELERAQADLEAASRLRGENLTSQSEYLARKADVAAARAGLETARMALDHISPGAPFEGVVNQHHVELGDNVEVGEPLVELVRTDRLKARGRVAQQKARRLEAGQPVRVALLDGRHLNGELTFIASAAHPETRSFAVEAALDNPGGMRVAGSTATLRIGLDEQLASRISPAYLELNEKGNLGVKHVDDDDRVRFAEVRLLKADSNGAWVDGLALETRLITRGAGFVTPGDSVVAVPAAESPEG